MKAQLQYVIYKMKNPLIIKGKEGRFVDLPKSKGILDDYAVRKVVSTKEVVVPEQGLLFINTNGEIVAILDHEGDLKIKGRYLAF